MQHQLQRSKNDVSVVVLYTVQYNENLTREMVDPALYTNNDMINVPARCQAIHPPSRKLFLHKNFKNRGMYGLTPSGYNYHIILSTGKDLPFPI